MPLRNNEIKNTKPDLKPKRRFDGGGLHLEVAPTGGKWWRHRHMGTHGGNGVGQEVKMGLSYYSPKTIG
ncbi:Arm DNA-binding domain-containing protein [Humidesulfovibrio sp.]|uniref:Arm DNA-binding domain-containing protein n=1 Tax=Humidesulfovibrio sp. TaxID=2910988 RepID=UPI0035BE4280